MRVFLISYFGSLLALASCVIFLVAYNAIMKKSEKKDGKKNG